MVDYERQDAGGVCIDTGTAPVTIRIAGLVEDSIVDGPGLRLTVFTQGCPHKCPGCHNVHTHAYDAGTLITSGAILERVKANPLLDGVTLSGGDPFEQAEALATLAEQIKVLGLSIITYTGYTYEQLVAAGAKRPDWQRLLAYTDYLVDGRFILAKRNLMLKYRGSENQRIIDVELSRELGQVVTVEL